MCPLGDLRADPPKAEESDRQMVEILDLPTPPRRFPDPSSHLRVALRDPLDQTEYQCHRVLSHPASEFGCRCRRNLYASFCGGRDIHPVEPDANDCYDLQFRGRTDDASCVIVSSD